MTTAVVLAAGFGRRLLPRTKWVPKCLVEVGGQAILARFLDALKKQGWRRVVIVAGHLGHRVEAFARSRRLGSLEIETVHCPDYATTNNIVSLHAVRERIEGAVLVADGDLVLTSGLLAPLARPDRIAVDDFDPRSMTGSTVSVDPQRRVRAMQVGATAKPSTRLFKTVNLTSLSADAWQALSHRIEARVRSGDVASFYEAALADLVAAREVTLDTVHFGHRPWVEVDCEQDWADAERLFGAAKTEAARELEAV